MQILSLALGNLVQALEPERSVTLSQTINDRLAEVVAAHPQRFAAFATLPMSAPEQAADELERAVRDLGHVGAMIHGQTGGDVPRRPVGAAGPGGGRAAGSVPDLPSPGTAPPRRSPDAYFSGLAPDRSLAGRGTAGWGWERAECGMHVLRMVLGGVFGEFPGAAADRGPHGGGLPSVSTASELLAPRRPGGPSPSPRRCAWPPAPLHLRLQHRCAAAAARWRGLSASTGSCSPSTIRSASSARRHRVPARTRR